MHVLDTEATYRNLLMAKGFESNGIQREVVYTKGVWHDLEILSLFREKTQGAEQP